MKLKRITALLLLLALVLCGCGQEPETPAEILEKMNAALAQTPCTRQEMTMDMTMTMDAGADGALEMELSGSNVLTVSLEPLGAHTAVSATVTAAGATSTSEGESYVLREDGGLTSYTCTGGIWVKTAPEMTEEQLRSIGMHTDLTEAALDETVSEWNGREAICLTARIGGEAIQSIVSGTIGSLGVEDKADYTALVCDVRLYLDAATYLPMAEEMTFTGMDTMLNAAFEDSGVSVTIGDCTASNVFASFEPQGAITLPEGAAESAAAWERLLAGECDNGDGTYTIREGKTLIDVVPPEGFTLQEKDYDHVTFTRDDHRTVSYTMWYVTGDPDEYFTARVGSDESRYSQNGGKTEREQITGTTDTLPFTCDIMGVTWSGGREDVYISGWSILTADETGTYCLLVEITDGYNDAFGNSKSADITPDEFLAYLNAASLSPFNP